MPNINPPRSYKIESSNSISYQAHDDFTSKQEFNFKRQSGHVKYTVVTEFVWQSMNHMVSTEFLLFPLLQMQTRSLKVNV